MTGFGEVVDPAAAIASILGTYPFSIGLLREILQNSDDAKANTQVFLLDHRKHGSETLIHEALGDAQGPALLAYNNGKFEERDWNALRSIHQSSKRTDTSKIGKYGIGFRVVYHITDTPQILSGRSLAILDPQGTFSTQGGEIVDFTVGTHKYADQLASFNIERFVPSYQPGTPFEGTIIRLPLRREGTMSRISSKSLSSEEVRHLLIQFVGQEMDISLLFLRNLSSINVQEVHERHAWPLGRTKVKRSELACSVPDTKYQEVIVTSSCAKENRSQTWHIAKVKFPEDMCLEVMTSKLEYDADKAAKMMAEDKLSPEVALAIQVPLKECSDGRLFTFLPLPLPTGFPCHVHALFALTQARQNLFNCSERGLVRQTRDELRVVWNTALFDTFIPKAWASSLQLLAESVPDLDPTSYFHTWPPASQDAPGGDPFYWRKVGLDLLQVLQEDASPVWPLVGYADFVSVRSMLVGKEEDVKYVDALALAGVLITMPPRHIVEMIEDVGEQYRMLTPERARESMMQDATQVLVLEREEKQLVLEYLLSEKNLKMLVGVFVVPLVNGDYTALEKASASNGLVHTLLKSPEDELFGRLDDEAISVSALPSSVRGLFLQQSASQFVNVEPLRPARVLQYLTDLDHNREHIAGGLTKWLFRFWAWLSTWAERDSLFQMLGSLPLIPDTEGDLHAVSVTLFCPDEIDNITLNVLLKLGLTFLHLSLPQSAITFLETKGVVKSAQSPKALLHHLQPHQRNGLNQEESRILCNHIVHALSRLSGVLTEVLTDKLRELPVFPIMICADNQTSKASSSQGGDGIRLGPLPKGVAVHVVDVSTAKILAQPMEMVPLLPQVKNTVFVAHTMQDLNIIGLVSHAAGVRLPTTEPSLLDIFVDNMASQPRHVQKEFLGRLTLHRQAIVPQLFKNLGSTVFLPVGNGKKLAAPENVVDPKHKIAHILDDNDSRLPCMVDANVEAIVKSLRSLRLHRTTLSDDLVKERLKKVSKSVSHKDIATHLLHLLNDTKYDCSEIQAELKLRWLPASGGLQKPSDCRDDRPSCPSALFDHVLHVLDVREFTLTSESLRVGLGWHEDIPLDILKRQLDAELNQDPSPDRLALIIQEFGRRVDEVEEAELVQELQRVTSMRQWVPVVGGGLATTSRALLNPERSGVALPFQRVKPKLVAEDGVSEFLLLIGCAESAPNKAILEEISAFGTNPLAPSALKEVVKLIGCLDLDGLTVDHEHNVLVPDINLRLQPLHKLYHDDLGIDVNELDLPEGRHRIQDTIPRGIIPRLGIQTLSSLNLGHMDVDDEDMREDLTTRISGILRQYSVDQAFNEFLANAHDAGATQYEILLDRKLGKVERILSSKMAQFQACPALVIFNNSVFKDKDWKGILDIGTGGKQGEKGTIGRYGLGSIAQFHFAEVTTIVSGEWIMLLDPQKLYLPVNGRQPRAVVRVKLSRMRRLHKDHLDALEGLNGFTSDLDFYDGTLFRLPLRNDSQANASKLSSDALTAQAVLKLIEDYGSVAPQSLLNIDISSIKASKRDVNGAVTTSWSAKASRQTTLQAEHEPTCQRVNIKTKDATGEHTDSWHVVTESVDLDVLPVEFKSANLAAKHRMKNMFVGLAGLVSAGGAPETRSPRYKLYSKLPLPTLTSLPIHVDASFILADDRRSIRFDESGQLNLESRYNSWLLHRRVPELYTFFLETWPEKKNVHLWPGAAETDDPISRLVVDGFYSNSFASSTRKLCLSMSDKRLSPSDAVFLGAESKEVKKIIEALKPSDFVKLPRVLRSRVLGPNCNAAVVDADALRDLILHADAKFRDAFNHQKIKVEDIAALLRRMQKDSSSSLLGLPILPLADGSLGSVGSSSDPLLFTLSSSSTWKPWPLFPAHRFIHVDAIFPELINDDVYNIQKFTAEEAVELVSDILPQGVDVAVLDAQQEDWVRRFWEASLYSGIQLESVSSLPLVPTDRDKTFISLKYCQNPRVLAYRPAEDSLAWLGAVMKKLGAMMVVVDGWHPSLRGTAEGIPALLLDFDNVLRFLETLEATWPQRYLRNIDSEDQALFSTFALEHLRSLRIAYKKSVRIEHLPVARQLPIWEAQKDGRVVFVQAADSSLRMLPLRPLLNAVKMFLGQDHKAYTNNDTRLRDVLGVEPITLPDLFTSLALPATLDDQDRLSAYKSFLEQVLPMLESPEQYRAVQVPNRQGRLIPITGLFARSVLLFRTVFGEDSDRFVHPEFEDLEERLKRSLDFHGSVTFAAFKACATFFDGEEDEYEDDEERATALYAYYNGDLWSTIMKRAELWEELDELRFIPRDQIRRHYPTQVPGFSPADYAEDLPMIVSPDEILRTDLQAVAWTQRALASIEPSEHLLVANPHFGVPTAEEVVQHLQQLVVIADAHPKNKSLLADLTETYRWLTDHKADCKAPLLHCKDQLLFLNVDDPSAPWRFSPAQHILFNGHDEDSWQCARDFLLPYKALLLSVGAKEIKQAMRPPLVLSPADQVLVQLRTALNKQRQDQRLTDVELLSSDGHVFVAHKAILAASSQHFDAMFGRDWSEHQGQVDTGETSEVLKQVLDYLYVGEIQDLESQEVLMGLLELADRWNLPELFKCVEHQLIPTISLGTWADLKQIGEKYRATVLVNACEEFRDANAQLL